MDKEIHSQCANIIQKKKKINVLNRPKYKLDKALMTMMMINDIS